MPEARHPAPTPREEPNSRNAPSTVRKRKKNDKAAVQRFLPVAEIRNDTVILKNGGLRAVLQVEALNFNLKSETEQEGIIAGYQAFINTLAFPVQVAVKSRRVDIAPYIEQIEALAAKQSNELLKNQSMSYALFVRKLVEIADIMQKRFYVLVPLDDVPQKRSSLSKLLQWFGIDDTASKAVARYRSFAGKHVRLKERVTLVESGLTNIGLSTRRLTTRQLIEFYYQIYNPRVSLNQKLPEDLNTAPLAL